MRLRGLRSCADALRMKASALDDHNVSEELPLDDHHARVACFVERANGHGKHCARSAVCHLSRAWALRIIDPEMSAFHALTAEEEGATAVFHSLKRQRYEGAELLRHRDHVTKAALFPFFQVVSDAMAQGGLNQCQAQLVFDESGPTPRIHTQVVLPGPTGKLLSLRPDPPLHFEISVDDKRDDFREGFDRACSIHGVTSIIKYVRARANRRNRLLYATTGGVPKLADDIDSIVLRQRDIAFTHLTAFYMIDQTAEYQDFVQQCLSAFLKMLNMLPKASVEEPGS